MNRKFEITTEEKIIMKNNGVKVKVYRIRSLRNFETVKVGQLGGFVEKEENLSHEGNCFIYDDAVVCEDESLTKRESLDVQELLVRLP